MALNEAAPAAVLEPDQVEHEFPLNLDPIVAKVDEGIALLESVLSDYGADPVKTARHRNALATLRDVRKTTRGICPTEEWGSA